MCGFYSPPAVCGVYGFYSPSVVCGGVRSEVTARKLVMVFTFVYSSATRSSNYKRQLVMTESSDLVISEINVVGVVQEIVKFTILEVFIGIFS